mgnify:CR=1 FL=1
MTYAAFYRRDPSPDSEERWHLLTADTIDEILEDSPGRGANVLGQVFDLGVLDPTEQEELLELGNLATSRQTADQRARERELLVRCPRHSFAGIDNDFNDADAARRVEGLLLAELARRRVSPRISYSSGSGIHRHYDLGPYRKGHPRLAHATFAWAKDVCRAAGLVPRKMKTGSGKDGGQAFWVFPEDPYGDLGAIDLSPMKREPSGRGSLFRPLGGLAKDGIKRKTLVPSSPRRPSEWTEELMEHALELLAADPDPALHPMARKTRKPWHGNKPRDDAPGVASFPRLVEWVSKHWHVGGGHTLRMTIAGALIASGLVDDNQGVDALWRGTGNLNDSRDAWFSTKSRLEDGLSVVGAPALRKEVTSEGMRDLAWELWNDLVIRGSNVELFEVWRRFGGQNRVPAEIITPLVAELATRVEKGKGEKQIKRIKHCARCGDYATRHTACDLCGGHGCPKCLYCGVIDLCGSCIHRTIRTSVEALVLPKKVTMDLYYFDTRQDANKFSRTLKAADGLRPLRFVTPSGDRWQVLSVQDSTNGVEMWGKPTERIINAPHLLVRGYITNALLARHVLVRTKIEQGDAVGAADALLSLYCSKSVRSRVCQIHWPSQKEIAALARSAVEGREAEEGQCVCPTECVKPWVNGYDILEQKNKRILARNVAKKPKLYDACEIVDGKAKPEDQLGVKGIFRYSAVCRARAERASQAVSRVPIA